jgi:hypothetical protein
MDASRFDRLVRDFSTCGTRRGLVRLLTALSLGMTLPSIVGNAPQSTAEDDDHGSSHRHHRRVARHRHDPGKDKEHRKGKGKGKGKSRRRGCTPTTCAAQGKTCGDVADGCGGTLNCGTCATGQVCNGGACICTSASCPTGCCAGTTCEVGNTKAACGERGVSCLTCHSDPAVVCRNDEWINGTCIRICTTRGDPVCGGAGSPCVCEPVFAAGDACVNLQPDNCTCFDEDDTCAAECPPGRVCIARGFAGNACTSSQMACCPTCAAT